MRLNTPAVVYKAVSYIFLPLCLSLFAVLTGYLCVLRDEVQLSHLFMGFSVPMLLMIVLALLGERYEMKSYCRYTNRKYTWKGGTL